MGNNAKKIFLYAVLLTSATAAAAQTDAAPVSMAAQTDSVLFSMEQDTLMLGEVVVKGHRPQYRKTAEGLQTNIRGTVLSKAGTAEDVLRRVPSIRRKADGSWEVFGKGTPFFYLNGRKVDNLSELANVKSGDIQSIELIQHPGAKYDAEAGAVVRIKTIASKEEGLSLEASTNYQYNRYNHFTGQLDATYRHNRLSLFATYKYNNTLELQDASFEQTVYGDTLWSQHNDNYSTLRKAYHFLQAGLSYDISDNHTVGARYATTITTSQHKDWWVNTDQTANGAYYDKVETVSRDDMDDRPTHQANAFYHGTIGQTTVDFNTDLYLKHAITDNHTLESSQAHDSRDLFSRSTSRNTVVASKLVLTSPLLGGSLDYGAEYTYTHRKDHYAMNRADIMPEADSKIRERNISPFFQYTRLTPIGQFIVGLRYEDVRFKYYEDGQYLPGESRNFHNLFPSISYAIEVGGLGLELAYNVTTKRPNYSQLSANTFYCNRFTRQSGNPLLTHQTNHAVSLAGSWRFIQFYLEYKDARNAIIYWAEQLPENEAITLVRYKNQPSIKSFSAYVSAAPKIGCWTPQVNIGLLKQWLTVETAMGNYRLNRPILTAEWKNAIALPCGFTLFADLSHEHKGDTENIRLYKNKYVVDLGVSKSFLNDALTVELKSHDLFYQAGDHDLLIGERMTIEERNNYGTRNISATLRYTFNATKNKYKGKSAGQSEIDRL